MVSHQTVFALVISILIASFKDSYSHGDGSCVRSCPNGKSAETVPYPFGFSEGCIIRLNCSASGERRIGKFKVHDITPTSIFVDLPAKCNRSIESVKPLFGSNHGLTWENSLLLQDCPGSHPNSCLIPFNFIEKRANLSCAHNKNESLRCFSEDSNNNDIVDYEAVKNTSCKYLFASIATDSGNSLEFQTLELGWWLNGSCPKCHPNANCTDVKLPKGEKGFRCQCKEGFHGDGFSTGGSGCRKGESTWYYIKIYDKKEKKTLNFGGWPNCL